MNPAMAMQHQHAHAAMLYAQQHGVPPPGVAFQGVPAPRGGGGGAPTGYVDPMYYYRSSSDKGEPAPSAALSSAMSGEY